MTQDPAWLSASSQSNVSIHFRSVRCLDKLSSGEQVEISASEIKWTYRGPNVEAKHPTKIQRLLRIHMKKLVAT